LLTALALSSRIGVRSLKSDRSFSTTSRPNSKGKMGWLYWSWLAVDRYFVIAESFLLMYSTLWCISGGQLNWHMGVNQSFCIGIHYRHTKVLWMYENATPDSSTYLISQPLLNSSLNINHFLPSTIMIWYPNPVLTSTYFGSASVLVSSSKAFSSNVGSKSPLFFHPKAPPGFEH